MTITITLQDVEGDLQLTAGKVHSLLVGSKDYIDSNILLSFMSPDKIDLVIGCKDMEDKALVWYAVQCILEESENSMTEKESIND